MPTDVKHGMQFKHNCKLLVHLLEKVEYTDWIIVVAFYFSIHCIEWYLVKKYRWHSKTHEQRDDKIRQCPELSVIYGDYRELSHLSREVRYDCTLPTLKADDVSFAIDTADAIQKHISSLDRDFPTNIHVKTPVSSGVSVVPQKSTSNKAN